MKKITYKGKEYYLYDKEEHSKALEAISVAKRVKENKELLESLESVFVEEVGLYE